jgi:hypothetical protein
VNVTIADRRGQSGAQEVAGEHPFDLHAVTGENGTNCIRVCSAIAKADR